MNNVSELKGIKSVKVLNVLCTLLYGCYLLPTNSSKKYEEFVESFEMAEINEKKEILYKAMLCVDMPQDDVLALMSFCKDANGVQYSDVNSKNLNPKEIIDICIDVLLEVSKIKLFSLTEEQKKN